MLQEEVQLWVAARVDCDLKQRHEDVVQQLLEVSQLLLGVVHIAAARERKLEVSHRQQERLHLK